jgi:hypothetical protein
MRVGVPILTTLRIEHRLSRKGLNPLLPRGVSLLHVTHLGPVSETAYGT